jgi:peptide-methionine (R)-S-oxide reductase
LSLARRTFSHVNVPERAAAIRLLCQYEPPGPASEHSFSEGVKARLVGLIRLVIVTEPVQKTDEEWRAQLTPEEYHVLRQAGTERAFTGEYTDTETTGVYRCKACQATLFESDTKFHSGCGWPSFYQPISDTITYIEDNTMGMKRTEVRCANCDSHLGHVFPDGYGTPTGDRYCINSISLTLEPADS